MLGVDVGDGVGRNALREEFFFVEGLGPGGDDDGLGDLGVAHVLPEFFGEERHDGVQEAEGAREDVVHDLEDFGLARGVVAVERLFGVFDVPVAVFVPEEFEDGLGVVVEAAALDVFVARGDEPVQPRDDVLVVGGEQGSARRGPRRGCSSGGSGRRSRSWCRSCARARTSPWRCTRPGRSPSAR